MKKLCLFLFIFLINFNFIYAFTWDDCIERYNKAKQFSENIKLSYLYLKSTKSCLIKFKKNLIQNPDPEFTVEAIKDNILMLDNYISNLLPKYNFPKNNLEELPKYIQINSKVPVVNEEYKYFKKYKNCNGIHADNKIYTAKHCNIVNAKDIQYDLSYIKTDKVSKLKTAALQLDELGTFKYYSMSKEGMFFNTILQEKNCRFYKAKNSPTGHNTTLDLADLTKKTEIRSNCLAIPSNSGGGVFQNGKLVGIISKTVFVNNKFSYSVVEPIKMIKEKND